MDAQLLQHGLLKGSFIPPRPQRELRDLTRQRTQLVDEASRISNRIQKVLEDANVKLGSVASNVVGASGRLMLEAIIAGQDDPVQLADLAQRRLRSKIPQLEQALYGKLTEHHRWLLRLLLDQLQTSEQFVARLDERIAELTRPHKPVLDQLDAIPGVDRRVAEVLIAEIGPDMTPFPSDAHLASWAGISPGNNESAGKKRSGKTTKGSRWLRQALVQAAWAASHKKEQLLPGACTQPHAPSWPQTRTGRSGTLPVDCHLSHAQGGYRLPRPWPTVPRPTACNPIASLPCPKTPTTRHASRNRPGDSLNFQGRSFDSAALRSG